MTFAKDFLSGQIRVELLTVIFNRQVTINNLSHIWQSGESIELL